MVEKLSLRGFKRGVYPLVIRVLLVAVVLVLILAIAGYIYSIVISTREYFELKPMLYITYSKLNPVPVLSIYVHNGGVMSETLLRVEIMTGSGSYFCEKEVLIEAGFRGHIVVVEPSVNPPVGLGDKLVECEWQIRGAPELTGGGFYVVKLHTARHGIITLNVLCQET
ncbi:MAG: hypothetical protein QW543_05620 [Sulfolobales archaeon]